MLLTKKQIEFLREEATALLPLLKPFEDSSVLITGCNGFIGSYLMDLFAWHNITTHPHIRVVGIDNQPSDRLKHLENSLAKPHNSCGVEIADLTNVERWQPRTNWTIHAASIAAPAIYKKYPLETIDVNINGTWNVLDNAHGSSGVLHFSSSEVYGDPSNVPTPESYWGHVSAMGPRGCYDESKRLSETLCWIYANERNVPVKIVRPFNIYGPGLNLDDGRVIPSLIKHIINGTEFEVHGDGTATRSYCYISDAVAQFLAVLINGKVGEAYNVGNDEIECSLNDLVSIAHGEFGGRPNVKYIPAEEQLKDAPTRRQPDLTKIMGITSIRPKVGIRTGLARTLRFHGDQ
jgi:UDP-glucuronate decarboxylase